MSTFAYSGHINASLDRVFDVFTDVSRTAERIESITRIELLTPGPMQVGTRWKETRVVFKKEATEEMEVTIFEPNQRYDVRCEACGAVFNTTFRFASDDGGTRVDVAFDCQAVSLFAKLMKPLSNLMLKSCCKAFEKDFNELRLVCEQVDQSTGATP